MKKRSMLAVASLAVGAAVAALSPAPAAQAAPGGGGLSTPDLLGPLESATTSLDGEEAPEEDDAPDA
ncbi:MULTISPECIES: hypothetical protein [unclassified Streptomyces]|uniref:hypothetical protein n=1 Tax=unclassified Streptomyces TaxID=2593676 RepID=UPI0033AC82F9